MDDYREGHQQEDIKDIPVSRLDSINFQRLSNKRRGENHKEFGYDDAGLGEGGCRKKRVVCK
jgi:hypothetical protein